MLRLRTGILALALWFYVFFNLERFDADVNIASFVYVLVPIAIAALLLAPKWFRSDRLLLLIIPVLVVYTALKIYLGYPLLGGTALATTTTEVVSIILSLMLTRQLVYIVRDFEDTVAKLTFRQIGLPPRLLQSVDTEDLYREVKRSRRFQHPLSMAVIEPDVDPKTVELNAILDDLKKSIAMRFVQARLAKLLSEELRDCDLIAQHGDGFAILFPEMTADETRRVAELLRAESQNRLGMDLNVGVASFPDGALTLGGLIDSAVDNLNENRQSLTEAQTAITTAVAGK